MEALKKKSLKLKRPRTKILAIGTIVTKKIVFLASLMYSLMKENRHKRE